MATEPMDIGPEQVRVLASLFEYADGGVTIDKVDNLSWESYRTIAVTMHAHGRTVLVTEDGDTAWTLPLGQRETLDPDPITAADIIEGEALMQPITHADFAWEGSD